MRSGGRRWCCTRIRTAPRRWRAAAAAVHAAAAMARIKAMAWALKASGAGGSIDLLCAQIYLGLLLGTLPLIPPADGAPPDQPGDGPGNDPGDGPRDDPGDGPRDDPGDGPRDDSGRSGQRPS